MIPEGFREKVLRLAHETLMSGHQKDIGQSCI